MAYDGRIMQRALTRFDEDKQRRAAQLEQRRRTAYARAPRLAEIEAELRGTMGRIISSALARGTDPVPAIRVLRDENLQLQQLSLIHISEPTRPNAPSRMPSSA